MSAFVPPDELYRVPPTEFVAHRDRLAAELKKAGKKDDAAAVKGMTKPPLSVWVVNQLARQAQEDLEAYLATGDRLAAAQGSGASSDVARKEFQAAAAAQKEALERLVHRMNAILDGAKLTASRDVSERATNNLRWGALDPEARSSLAAGRLHTDLEPPDFSALVGLIPLKDVPASGKAAPASKPAPGSAAVRSPPAHNATAAIASAGDRKAAAAERHAREIAEKSRELSDELAELKARNRQLDSEAGRIGREAERAETSVKRLREELADAERALTEARARWKKHETELAQVTSRRAVLDTQLAALEKDE